MNNKLLFVLGADSVEMSFIAAALDLSGQMYVKARRSIGFNVRQKNVAGTEHYFALVQKHAIETVVFVDCYPDDKFPQEGLPVRFVGYRESVDIGHGLPVSEYRTASSIGQVFEILEDRLTKPVLIKMLGEGGYALDLVDIVSAYSFCLSDAYRGECPGIIPAQMSMFCRMLSVHNSAWSKLIRNERNRLRYLFSTCSNTTKLAGQSIYDFRVYGGFKPVIMREIQIEVGKPVVFYDGIGGVYLMGAKPWAITEFALELAKRDGLVDVKSSPDSGEAFARKTGQVSLLRTGT